jgi:hypothetical protein
MPWTTALLGEDVALYGEYASWAIGLGWGVVIVPFVTFLYFFFSRGPDVDIVE